MERWFELYRNIVMPAHCDVYGHMNVRQYAAFFDDAGWHMLGMAGISLDEVRARGLGTVAAQVTIDFVHEINAGQLFVIKGAFTKVGTKSFIYEMRMFESGTMTHCSTQKSVEVCFDTRARKSAPLPEDMAAKLRAVCLPAG